MFEILDDGGRFEPGPLDPEAEDLLDAILEQREGPRRRLSQYIASLEALTEKYPAFIDGHAHLGFALLENGKPKHALGACQKGLAIGEAAIPAKFKGRIEWGWLENRPFCVLPKGRLSATSNSAVARKRSRSWNGS